MIRSPYLYRISLINNLPIAFRRFFVADAQDIGRKNRIKKRISKGPDFNFFLSEVQKNELKKKIHPCKDDFYLEAADYHGNGRKVMYVVHGCQMNTSDMEIVRSVMLSHGYKEVHNKDEAEIILLMTCSIRESAEEKVWQELRKLHYNYGKKKVVGILGCMAERVRDQFFLSNNFVDIVAGPDSYRDLPRLLTVAFSGSKAINVQLSLEETYADIIPTRINSGSKSAFVSIMRGCNNMCAYCIVPFTRGREKSRPMKSIIEEVQRLSEMGIKEVILLGQNVNSYNDLSEFQFPFSLTNVAKITPGFNRVYKEKKIGRVFADLLDRISVINNEMRIRFTSPHPKDFPVELLELMHERQNICKQIHLPAQSGNNTVLEAMKRGYTRESYIQLVEQIRKIVPDVSLTSDFIAGFCGETEEAHMESLDLIRKIQYSFCYVFPYSIRQKTKAHYHLNDDVPIEVKRRRHHQLAEQFRIESAKYNAKLVGTIQLVLVELFDKRTKSQLVGKTDGGTKVIIRYTDGIDSISVGDYVAVEITNGNSQTLRGTILKRTTMKDFYSNRIVAFDSSI